MIKWKTTREHEAILYVHVTGESAIPASVGDLRSALDAVPEADRETLCEECELQQQLAEIKEGRRRAAQMLIEEIGAPGPESIEETAARAIDIIREERAAVVDRDKRIAEWIRSHESLNRGSNDALNAARAAFLAWQRAAKGAERRLAEVELERDDARAAFSACDEQRQRNQDDAEAAEKRLAVVELERDEIRRQLSDLEAEHAATSRKKVDLGAQVDRLRNERDESLAEVERLRNNVAQTTWLVDAKAERLEGVLQLNRILLGKNVRLRPVLNAARQVLANDDADAMVALQTAVEACDSGAESSATKTCSCPGGPVEHIMSCEAKPAADTENQENTDVPDGAPERVWCLATYDSSHDDYYWGQSGWWADCEQYGIGRQWQVQYIHPDVTEQEKQNAVREALELAAERVASKITHTYELGSVLVCGHGIPIDNDDEMPKAERAIQRELRAAILFEEGS